MALPDIVKYTPTTNRNAGISSVSLVDGSNYLGTSIDNATNLDLYADVEIVWTCSSAPAEDAVLELYILYAHDGTNYEDGAGNGTANGNINPKAPLIGIVRAYPDTGSHRVVIRHVRLQPYPFKLLVRNQLGQSATVTVNVKTYNIQIID